MKKTILSVFAIALTVLTSCKKEQPSKLYTDEEKKEMAEAVVDPATAPALTFDEVNFDFGDVQAQSKVDHYFAFTNTGKSPLIIKEAKGSCGCTVPEYPKEPIAVGAKDSIKITFTAGNSNGRQNKNVTLTTNTVNGTEKLNISANVVGATANDNSGIQQQPFQAQ